MKETFWKTVVYTVGNAFCFHILLPTWAILIQAHKFLHGFIA
jgi:hypothetical protein